MPEWRAASCSTKQRGNDGENNFREWTDIQFSNSYPGLILYHGVIAFPAIAVNSAAQFPAQPRELAWRAA